MGYIVNNMPKIDFFTCSSHRFTLSLLVRYVLNVPCVAGFEKTGGGEDSREALEYSCSGESQQPLAREGG